MWIESEMNYLRIRSWTVLWPNKSILKSIVLETLLKSIWKDFKIIYRRWSLGSSRLFTSGGLLSWTGRLIYWRALHSVCDFRRFMSLIDPIRPNKCFILLHPPSHLHPIPLLILVKEKSCIKLAIELIIN
jgi:hypothetical protein